MEIALSALAWALSETGFGTVAAIAALATLLFFGLWSLRRETAKRMRENPRGEMKAWNRTFRMMGMGRGWRFDLNGEKTPNG